MSVWKATGERNAPTGRAARARARDETPSAARASGAFAAAEKGDAAGPTRPALAGYVATAFRALGV